MKKKVGKTPNLKKSCTTKGQKRNSRANARPPAIKKKKETRGETGKKRNGKDSLFIA